MKLIYEYGGSGMFNDQMIEHSFITKVILELLKKNKDK